MQELTRITLDELLLKLEKQTLLHFEILQKMSEANNAVIYPLDLRVINVGKRSLSLIKGYTDMILSSEKMYYLHRINKMG
jgi:hypothetical protein